MKTHKKHKQASGEKPAPAMALSPRQIALRKLYRIFLVFGGLALFVGGGVAFTLYGDRLRPKNLPKFAKAHDLDSTEPKLNPADPPGSAPDGMVWIRGGEFYMGCNAANPYGQPMFPDAGDIHMVHVDGFWMDKHEVTNAQFARFVAATGYLTDAEKNPDPKDFPKVPPDKLKPFSIVFRIPLPGQYDLRNHDGWWDVSYGACWKHPDGPDSNIKGKDNFPVVHVSHNDAVAYCKWAGKRLPTEAEWEFAARGGLDRNIFTWGDEEKPNDKWLANVWQGNFPVENTKEDGFEFLAPVGSYAANGYGLHDMAGNVWEWCADWYQADYYRDSPKRNPKGPNSGFDPFEPGQPKRVQRGGSFLCADNYCMRYIVGSRGKGEVTSAQSHSGFRCVQDAK